MFKYSHLASKISAMKGKMLKQTDYEILVYQKTVRDAAIYLKNQTYYMDLLKDLDENNVHRGYLEILLNQSLVNDELKIARYLKGNEKKTYRYVYRKQEIEDIKKMLRFLQMGKSVKNIDKNLFFISKYSVIDFDKLFKVNNIEELVDGLKGTNFYNILKPLIIDENRIDLFAAEMALDMYYYKKTDKQLVAGIRGKNKKILKKLLGIEVDMKNILWIYRSKRYYKTPKELIYRYIIPYQYKLSKKELSKMIEVKTTQEFLDLLRDTKYSFDVGKEKIKKEKTFLEVQLSHYKKYMKDNPFSMAPISVYIFMKEIEISNITTIIEGIRYQVEPNEIKQLVIGIQGW
ncbi:MAG: V-type ATPase subunit [Eubacteriales bacterium]